MTAERWQKIEEICQAALDRPADKRAAFVVDACKDDDSLRIEIESLLSHSDKAENFIEGPAVDVMARSLATDPGDKFVGKTIGHYRVISLLGTGGMGEVYLAKDNRLERIVVLKFLPEALRIDENSRRRFHREARLASAIDHTNICTIYEINEESGVDFIAMQYVDGRTLKQVIAERKLEIENVLSIAVQLASGLAAAHELGIVHRDLKPTNIVISTKGQVKILDFGLAKLFERKFSKTGKTTELTLKGSVMGTPAYMSPEQIRSVPVDHRSDFFSLGVILYEMATGRSPFNHSDRSSIEVMNAVVHEDPEPVANFNSAVPLALRRIIERSMEKLPDKRYQSAQEILNDLNRAIIDTPTQTNNAVTARLPAHGLTTGENKGLPWSALSIYAKGFIAFVILASVSFASWFFFRRNNIVPTVPDQVRSLAVLPFKNATGDAANDYLCDGMTESIITSLAKVENLTVIARDSSFTFKDKEINSAEIGEKLGVESVLIGSVQKDEDALRVSARLVGIPDGRVLWATDIRKQVGEIFVLQEEIARNVVERLKPQIAGRAEKTLAVHTTDNVEAYKLYMKGRFFWHEQTEESLNKSVEYFTQAAALDPNYVAAYSGLSDAHISLGFYFRPPNEVMPEAGFYASKALALDENSPDAHYSLAAFKFWYERDWAGTEQELERTLKLAPKHSLADDLYGNYLMAFGRKEEALAEVKRAIELDPLAHFSNCDLGMQYYNSGQYEQAISYSRQNLKTVDYCPYEYLWIGESLDQEGKYQESVGELNKVQTRSKDWPPALSEQGYAYALSGQRAKAQETIRSLNKLSAKRFVDPLGVSNIYLALGDREAALAWLEKAVQARSPFLAFLMVDSKYDGLRDDPHFDALIRRLGLHT